tara:strand:- start:32 stop:463 length:432 start_codon:yes stop_codon:yes gene_type:complete
MSFFESIKISSSGLSAQRQRMNILSSNLANAQTTRTENGTPYRRKDVVFSAVPTDFRKMLDSHSEFPLRQVKVVEIHEDQRDPKKVFDPTHADADEKGYVSMPNIQVMTEMVNLITATRSYEANVTALNAAKDMAQKALEIGA